MSKQPRVGNSMYGFLPREVGGFGSRGDLGLDMHWPLPMELVGWRTKKGERS